MAYGAGHFLVVWPSDNPGFGPTFSSFARVTPAGVVEDAPVQKITGLNPSVTFDGTNFFVVTTIGTTSGWHAVSGVRVAPNGTILDTTPFTIADTTAIKWMTDVVFDGETYVVVWAQQALPQQENPVQLFVTRVGLTGTVLDFPYIPVSTSTADELRPRLATAEGTTLVVWEDRRNDPGSVSVYGARIAKGKLLDSMPILVAVHPASRDERPTVVYSAPDKKFRVAWEHGTPKYTVQPSLQTVLVGLDGAVGAEETLVDVRWGTGYPALAAASTGPPLLAYAEFHPGAPFGSFRAEARLFTDDAGIGDGGSTTTDGGGAGGGAEAGDDAGAAAGSGSQPPGSSDCGCAVPGRSTSNAPMLLSALLLAALVSRVRRKAAPNIPR